MSKEPVTKKSNTMNGGLYIALAICILSVICIGVYSAIINIFDANLLNDATKVPSDTTKPSTRIVAEDDPGTTQIIHEEIPRGTESVVQDPEPADETPSPIAEVTSFTRPVAGAVLKEFSDDILVYSQTMNDYRVHNGVDLQANIGDAVKAFANGKISEVYEDPLMGITVVIDHGNGLKSIYQNLSDALPEGIEAGKSVSEGEVIAGIGETSLIECAQEPHLHFEVIKNEKSVNPLSYFE